MQRKINKTMIQLKSTKKQNLIVNFQNYLYGKVDKINWQNKIIKIQININSSKSSARKIMNGRNWSCFQEQNSWFDCIGDIQEKQKQKRQQKITQYEPQFVQNGKNVKSSFETENSKDMDLVEACKKQDKKVVKRGRNNSDKDEQYFTENSSSNEMGSRTSDGKNDEDNGRTNKEEKQHIYSKTYRQRKKEQSKLIEEQNEYLKKKVQQLEFKVRELELENSRLKYVPEQKQLTIQQLNEQFMEKVTVIMVKNKDNPAEYRNKYEPNDQFYSQFMETYSKHGFGGSKKIDIMNYYFNQVIESILRDSEKYFAMLCYKAKDGDSIQGFLDYQSINNAFWEILQPDEDKLNRLRYFKINLHPMFTDLVDACKQFNVKYNKILIIMEKIHVFMKTNYPSNFDFARKRIIELQSWFQQYKYSKMTRNLQKQWIQLIKSQITEDQRKNSTGTKKKKTNNKQF